MQISERLTQWNFNRDQTIHVCGSGAEVAMWRDGLTQMEHRANLHCDTITSLSYFSYFEKQIDK